MPKFQFTSRFALFSCTSFLLLGGAGCGTGSGAAALPSDQVARTALESALKAWQDGGKPGTLAGTDPAVVVHDTPWAQGAKLKSFEILQAESSGVEKRFSVRLALAQPAGAREVQYYVLGRGPVMVFRDEDYTRNINMEDGPKLLKPGSQPRRRK
jgi:hypothetical protein